MALSTMQNLVHYLSRLFIAPTRHGMGAFELPHEIILMISSQLDPASRTALALTCHTLYAICDLKSMSLNISEKAQLLLLVEKDDPNTYFCYNCTQLHYWRQYWGKIFHPWLLRLDCRREDYHDLITPGHYFLPFHHVRLIMNRHLYGPAHGLSVSSAKKRIYQRRGTNYIQDSASIDFEIIDNELYLHHSYSLHHPRGYRKALRNYVDDHGGRLCEHLSVCRGNRWLEREQLPELTRGSSKAPYFVACHNAIGSCDFCRTDYKINIVWRGDRRGYLMKLDVYRQIGRCRSPYDWDWRVMTERIEFKLPRTNFPVECRPGDTIDRWEKAFANKKKLLRI